MHPRTLVLVNPVAGNGRAKRAWPHVAAYLSQQRLPFDLAKPQGVEELRRTAAGAAASGYECILALGGDGTFQQLAKATLGTDVLLGFLPAGGGNDIADALHIPKDPIQAAHVFLRSRPRRVDMVRARFSTADTRYYIGGGGLGLDAEAARHASGRFRRLPGAGRYVAGALWALKGFRPFHVQVEIDGRASEEMSGPVMFVAVANAPAYGAGMQIAPEAKLDDGLLDVVLLGQLPWPRLLEAFPVLLQTGRVRLPEVRRCRARRVRLRAERPVLFHGDGEILGQSPVELENLPGAIRVMAPQEPEAVI